MAKVIFVTFDGTRHEVEASCGVSAMMAATANLVPGIDADCGGQAACGTCHVYVDPAWIEKAGPAKEGIEADMLVVTDGVKSNSRLSCQLVITEDLDGLVLHLPDGQH